MHVHDCHTSAVKILCLGQFKDSKSTPGNPWAFELFKIGLLKCPSGGPNCVQMPYPSATFDCQFSLKKSMTVNLYLLTEL